MDIITLILLLLAYTLGIATLIVQIVCFIRKIEYLETIVLVVSFLLLLMSAGVLEFTYLTGRVVHLIFEVVMYFLTIVLAFTISVNTHRERVLKNRAMRNRWAMAGSVLMVIFLATGYLFHFERAVRYAIFGFLNLSIFYAMITVIMTKPSLLIKHRERTERLSAIWIMLTMALLVLAGILFYRDEITSGSLLRAPVFLAVICIILCLLKLPDDILRLTMFGPHIKINPDDLAAWQITSREREVVELLLQGKSYRDISDKLFISMPTVKTHVSHIYQKLNVRNKIELVNLVRSAHTKV